MALGYVGCPPFPGRIQVRQRVDGGDAGAECVVRACQQLGTPARRAASRIQQRDLVLPAVERGVQRRQVGDLQRDGNDPDQRGDVEDGLLRPAAGNIRADLPQARPGGAERRSDTAVDERPEDQREADKEHTQPGDDLAEQQCRGLRRQDPVPSAEVTNWRGDQHVDTGHQPINLPGQPARDRPGNDQRADHAACRGDDEGNAHGSRDVTCSQRNDHVSPRPGPRRPSGTARRQISAWPRASPPPGGQSATAAAPARPDPRAARDGSAWAG